MSTTYTVVKQDNNVYAVQDDMGYTVETFSAKKLAADFIVDLQSCELRSHYVANTDWTGPNIVDADVVETTTEIAVDAKPKTVKPKLAVDSNGVKKSDRVRARIAAAKAADETQDTVIAWVIAELGMTKQLAKTYVKGNWNKV